MSYVSFKLPYDPTEMMLSKVHQKIREVKVGTPLYIFFIFFLSFPSSECYLGEKFGIQVRIGGHWTLDTLCGKRLRESWGVCFFCFRVAKRRATPPRHG